MLTLVVDEVCATDAGRLVAAGEGAEATLSDWLPAPALPPPLLLPLSAGVVGCCSGAGVAGGSGVVGASGSDVVVVVTAGEPASCAAETAGSAQTAARMSIPLTRAPAPFI